MGLRQVIGVHEGIESGRYGPGMEATTPSSTSCWRLQGEDVEGEASRGASVLASEGPSLPQKASGLQGSSAARVASLSDASNRRSPRRVAQTGLRSILVPVADQQVRGAGSSTPRAAQPGLRVRARRWHPNRLPPQKAPAPWARRESDDRRQDPSEPSSRDIQGRRWSLSRGRVDRLRCHEGANPLDRRRSDARTRVSASTSSTAPSIPLRNNGR